MTVDAKCNITSFALKKLSELYWGTKYKNVDDSIIENYAESLGCGVINICNPSDCVNETEILNCSLSITKISKTVEENTVTFYIEDEDLVGGTSPFQYEWEFEEDDFDNSGEIDVSQAILTIKVGKRLDLLVSLISVTITDINGCIAIKNCYITPSGMQCANDYVACPNNTALAITNKFIRCFSSVGLIVSKKEVVL